MEHPTDELVAAIERLGGRILLDGAAAAHPHPLARAAWPGGHRFRLGPTFGPDLLTLGAASTTPGLEGHPGAVCFGRNEDGDFLLLLLPDGSACTLDTSFRRRKMSPPEPPAALLSRLELDVAASGVAAPAREGRLYRTFNGSVVLAVDRGRRAVVLAGGHGEDAPVPGRGPGEPYDFMGDGVFDARDTGDEAAEFRLSNALSLKEELPLDLGADGRPDPPAYPGESLHPEVVRHIHRLGGTLPPPPAGPPRREWDGFPVPEPLRRLLWDVAWPGGRAYANGDEDDLRVWGYVPAAVGVDPSSAFLRAHPRAAGLGTADGGNYTLATVLDCPDPSDPPVYRLDHDEPDRVPDDSQPLSEFLASLWPDPRFDREPVPPAPGRLFRTANGSVVLVRSCDDRGGEVMLLLGGHGVLRDVPGRHAGETYRVDPAGLYDGPLAADLRPRMSLARPIPFDPGDPAGASGVPGAR